MTCHHPPSPSLPLARLHPFSLLLLADFGCVFGGAINLSNLEERGREKVCLPLRDFPNCLSSPSARPISQLKREYYPLWVCSIRGRGRDGEGEGAWEKAAAGSLTDMAASGLDDAISVSVVGRLHDTHTQACQEYWRIPQGKGNLPILS